MSDSNSILSMTEHGAYVWPSYAIVATVLIVLVVVSLRALKQTASDLERVEAELEKVRDET